MDNIKDDYYYIKRLLKSIEATVRYLGDKSMDDLTKDGFLCDAIENRFTKIAEDARHLSKEFKDSTITIPWEGIYSIRNRVCHDYDVVDSSILYKIIKVNFPQFKQTLLDSIRVKRMNLTQRSFEAIKSGNKKVEMRLFDENRRKLAIGDLIILTNIESQEELIVEITDLKQFDSFESLYSNYRKTSLGYEENEAANPKDMLAYYSLEDIKKWGVVGVEFKIY